MILLKNIRKASFFAIIIIIFLLFISCNFSIASDLKWDDNWSFSQEIIIPFDTSLEIAKFQPIDITIEFENPCWVKNGR